MSIPSLVRVEFTHRARLPFISLSVVSGLDDWPALVPALYSMLDSPEGSLVEGALSALNKICEARAPGVSRALAVASLCIMLARS